MGVDSGNRHSAPAEGSGSRDGALRVVVAALTSDSVRSGLCPSVDGVHRRDGIIAELGVVNVVVPQQICSIGRAYLAERPHDVATDVPHSTPLRSGELVAMDKRPFEHLASLLRVGGQQCLMRREVFLAWVVH
jgi:hypothetical protein